MAAKLRAVEADERSDKPKTILEAIECGDRFTELELTHQRIGAAVQDPETPARDLASLTRRQLEISRELEALRQQVKEESNDASTVKDRPFDAASI